MMPWLSGIEWTSHSISYKRLVSEGSETATSPMTNWHHMWSTPPWLMICHYLFNVWHIYHPWPEQSYQPINCMMPTAEAGPTLKKTLHWTHPDTVSSTTAYSMGSYVSSMDTTLLETDPIYRWIQISSQLCWWANVGVVMWCKICQLLCPWDEMLERCDDLGRNRHTQDRPSHFLRTYRDEVLIYRCYNMITPGLSKPATHQCSSKAISVTRPCFYRKCFVWNGMITLAAIPCSHSSAVGGKFSSCVASDPPGLH